MNISCFIIEINIKLTDSVEVVGVVMQSVLVCVRLNIDARGNETS